MNRFVVRCAIAACFWILALAARAQQPAAPPGLTACPSSATLEDLTKALDDAVSGPGNRDRTCLRQLMTADARLTPIRKEQDGSFSPHILTVQGWIDAVAKRGSDVFYERQVKVRVEQYGHFAHLWSTYEIRPTPDGKPEMTGINSIQAVFDGSQWKVLSILWEPDTTAGPVPERYRP
jgi:hypothetical protein